MFKKRFFALRAAAIVCFCSCGIAGFDRTAGVSGLPESPARTAAEENGVQSAPAEGSAVSGGYQPLDISILDAIAEVERSNGYVPGLGLREAELRENSGDLAGAVIAAYKEMAWAYSLNNAASAEQVLAAKTSIENGIEKIKELYSVESKPDVSDAKRNEAQSASDAALYFINGRYKDAADILSALFYSEEEPDAFWRWMRLVCVMEQDGADRTEQTQYAAIRARYSIFPAYWYFGARNFSGAFAADYAERCIDLYPDGPYAAECRSILAAFAGLSPQDGSLILSRNEIKQTIEASVKSYEPEMLSKIIPLVSLNDNPYTLFASAALRELAADKKYKAWFEVQADQAKKIHGKNSLLAGRLNHIARG
jgi:hypothetical protein